MISTLFFSYISVPFGYLTRLLISNSPDVSVADFWVMYSIISLVTFLYTYNDLWLTESLHFFLPRFYIKKEFNNIKTIIRIFTKNYVCKIWVRNIINNSIYVFRKSWFWLNWCWTISLFFNIFVGIYCSS